MKYCIFLLVVLLLCLCDSNPARSEECLYDGYSVLSFSDDGNYLTGQSYTNSENKKLWYCTFEYDDQGYMTTVIFHDSSGRVLETTSYVKDPLNNTEKEIVTNASNTMVEYSINEFDNNDNIITSSVYTPDDILRYVFRYNYDVNGVRTSYEKYDRENHLLVRYEYIRNSYGSLSRIERYDGQGNKLGYSEYEYIGKVMQITIRHYECGGELAKQRMSQGSMFSMVHKQFIRNCHQ